MSVTTVVKTIGTTGVFSTLQLWEDGAPANLTTSNNWAAGTFVGTFVQGEVVTGVGITGGKFLDSNGSSYITFGTTTTPAAGITVTGSTSLATCVLSGAANVGVIWRGECQNEEFSGAGNQLTINGSTADATSYKELTTVAGASFRDNANKATNALQYNASNGCGFRSTGANIATISVSEPFARVSNIQITATGASGRGVSSSGASQIYDNLIIEGTYAGTSSGIAVAAFLSSATVRNCVIIQRTSAADHIIATSTGSSNFYNCTFVAADDLATAPTSIFLSGASGTVTVQNCGVFAGDSTKAINAGSATFNFTTCYSDISGTAGVTQTTYSSEFQNVNDATRDFRLKSGAAQIDAGTTDATNAANDIIGTARPVGAAYDVGCWEFVPTAPVADFSGTPTSGTASLSVAFTDSSTNAPTSWLWEKDNGSGWVNFSGTPTVQNPTESFSTGIWSVRLTATNGVGGDTETKTSYITATTTTITTTTDGKSF